MVDTIKESIRDRIKKLEQELHGSIRYHRSSIVGQLIAHNEILQLIESIEKAK